MMIKKTLIYDGDDKADEEKIRTHLILKECYQYIEREMQLLITDELIFDLKPTI